MQADLSKVKDVLLIRITPVIPFVAQVMNGSINFKIDMCRRKEFPEFFVFNSSSNFYDFDIYIECCVA